MKRKEMWFRYGPTVKLLSLSVALSLLTSLVGIVLFLAIYGLTHRGLSMLQFQDSMPAIYEIAIQDLGMVWAIFIEWKHKVPLLAGILFFLGDTCIESLCNIRMPEEVETHLSSSATLRLGS